MEGRNIFQGGFLGLDNIALFDRSVPMTDGSYVDQSDATAWMAMYALNLMRIAMELATARPGLRGPRDQVLRALPVHRRSGARARRRDRLGALGRRRRLLLRRAAEARRRAAAAARALAGRPDPAARGRGAARRRDEASCRSSRSACAGSSTQRPGARAAGLALERHQQARVPPAVADAARPDESRARSHARRGRVPVRLRRALGVALPPRPSVHVAAEGRVAHRSRTSPARAARGSTAATRTGAGRSGCRSTTC